MALQSQLFRGDSKLDAALVSDPAHILQGAKGDHVARIQKALIQLDGAGISADGIFGPATGAAVGAFKKKRNILNAQGLIDQIVGKKTMAALDAEMAAKEKSGGSATGSSVAGGSRLSLVDGGSGQAPIRHTLIYFSGLSDNPALHGMPLFAGQREDVQIKMEEIDVTPDTTSVFGFGGAKSNPIGILAAKTIVEARDTRGKLIIYGFSSGGINAMTLCRVIRGDNILVDLLVTVDVTDGSLFSEAAVEPVIAGNVKLNRNYFQRTVSAIPTPRGIRTVGPNTQQIDCTNRPFSRVPRPFGKNNHGQMETITQAETIEDMRRILKSR